MILQALADYYLRRVAAEPGSLPGLGWDRQPIHFVMKLDLDGKFRGVLDLRVQQGKKWIAPLRTVPQSDPGGTSNIAANLLWDNVGYVLGYDAKGNPKRAAAQLLAFIEKIRDRAPTDHPHIAAVLKFLESNPLDSVQADPQWAEIIGAPCNLSFAIEGQPGLVVEQPELAGRFKTWVSIDDPDAKLTQCLLTGGDSAPAKLHPDLRGVRGANTTGAAIVSFNKPAFASFGAEQSLNAPVSTKAAAAYTTALNHLLARDSRQKFSVGDTTAVAWSQNDIKLGEELRALFDEFGDDPDGNISSLQALYSAPHTGSAPYLNDNTPFYVLGLSPNAARLSIRFWYPTTVREIAGSILRWFEDIRLVGPEWVTHAPAVQRLLRTLAAHDKADNIPPNLAGDVMKAILSGEGYPLSLLAQAVGRERADRARDSSKIEIFEFIRRQNSRAGLIKAVLVRNFKDGDLTMSLSTDNANIGYRLGRLFAALEKAQEEAHPEINATIRDRYYGAVSSTPGNVLPILMRLKNHHLAKLEPGRRINLERLIGEIHQSIENYPPHLPLADQGRFAIGYYHQRQAFYTRSSAPQAADTEKPEETP